MEQKTEASQVVDPDMLDSVTSKVAEFYPQSLPRDMEKNQRLARAILRLVNRAALKSQPAPTDPIAWMCPNDPDSASAFIWARKGVDYSNMSCDACGGKHVPVYRQPAPAEAAQGEDSARLDAVYAAQADAILGFAQAMVEAGVANPILMKMAKGCADKIRAPASAETGGVK